VHSAGQRVDLMVASSAERLARSWAEQRA